MAVIFSVANLVQYKDSTCVPNINIAAEYGSYSRVDSLRVILKLIRGSVESILWLSMVLYLGLGFSTVSFSQTSTGSITGIVSDPSGAVVPGTAVTAMNKATSNEFKASSKASGVFNLGSLPSGTYTLSVTKVGFRTYTITEIILLPGQVLNQNITLQVSSQTQTISVEAHAPVVNTASGATEENDYKRADCTY